MSEERSVTISVFAQTDVGKVRQNNEDNFLVADLTQATYQTATSQGELVDAPATIRVGEKGFVAAVSDGMGGALAGEVASDLAVKVVRRLMLKFQSQPEYAQFPFSEQFRLAVEQANKLIHSQSQTSPHLAGMGATFTGLAYHQGHVYLAQVGDSRAYILRGHQIIQATKDQSLVGQLVDAGYLTEEQAQEHVYKNVILQALGAQPDTVVVLDRLTLHRNDVFLLCSDGLSNKVQGRTLMEVISSSANLKQAAEQLISLANERGGEDNITVVLCQFIGDDLPPSAPDILDINRVERDESLPVTLLSDLVDPDMSTDEALEDTAHPPGVAESPMATQDPEEESLASRTGGDKLRLAESSSLLTASPLERNMARFLIGLLIVIVLGAVLAVVWYLRLWREKDQNPMGTPSPSMTMDRNHPKALSRLIPEYLYHYLT